MEHLKIKRLTEDLSEKTGHTKEALTSQLESIIDSLPDTYSNLINEAFDKKRVPKEYMLSAILFSVSSAAGCTFYTYQNNYENYANAYFLVVGSRGDAKSEALKLATKPIMDFDNKSFDTFQNDLQQNQDVKQKQVLLQKASIEKAYTIMDYNSSGIGIRLDEVRSTFEKIKNPNSRDGLEWERVLLSAFSNDTLSYTTKTSGVYRIKNSYVTFFGGIQNQLLNSFFDRSLINSGLTDRFLLTPNITSNKHISRELIDHQVIDRFNKTINSLLNYRSDFEDNNQEVDATRVYYSDDADDLFFEYSQKLLDLKYQSTSPLSEYYAKMMIYLHKLALLCYLLKSSSIRTYEQHITVEDFQLAKKLLSFYINCFKSCVKSNAYSEIDLKKLISYAKKNNATQKSVVEISGYSKSQVSKVWSKIK
ncbi:DUF3987 domain-containing protein [Psychroflexus sp. ALD_RP9]|uniref:DUF3987 domain-containing protein n=1 Tax=Psychroflexus sp. ALD_RP9 TaxID=2777186 RepID=UPI001A8D4C7E|nr:DUF3987 domain-containing protein [Psychroflexus sp. ALD_RP9]QSS97816.1 DUF3987 domain-containing protein [Psychroflexus sp. ALD_RP9]